MQAAKLQPIGMAVVHGVHGPMSVERCLVNIRLPNDVQFYHVEVTVGDMAGCEVLIGMDIITIGDFAVTNRNGVTVMSFRTPSQGLIDYVKLINAQGGTNSTPKGKGKKKRR
jgi:hypothetical protein